MSRSSARRETAGAADRGTTDPLAALAAVFAVGVAVSMYAGAIPEIRQGPDRVAETALSDVHERASEVGVVVPERLDRATAAGPHGYALNITLSAGDRDWTLGPERPPDCATATRPVSVASHDGEVAVGRLSVGVWT